MVGASDGRSCTRLRRFGVSVFDFKMPSGEPSNQIWSRNSRGTAGSLVCETASRFGQPRQLHRTGDCAYSEAKSEKQDQAAVMEIK